ncbi:MAG: SDR family NAD(P)-dependent oxidoreductase, partial [Pseudomonadota bacterium]
KGIGSATARRLGECGAHVIAHYGSDRAGAEAATAAIPAERKCLLQADLGDLDAVERLWAEASAWRGRIDVLVNNAATMRQDGGPDAPLADWDSAWEESLRINVLAPARLMRRAVLDWRGRGGGAIVTISSWAAQRGVTNPASIAYGASKAAVRSATQTLARAYARDCIYCYAIAPGVVGTRLSEQFAETQGGKDKVFATLAMGDWVQPAEIADVVAFLCTGSARNLSGGTIDMNGASYVR